MESQHAIEANLLTKWLRRVKRKQLAHRLAAKRKGNYHLLIGVPATVLAAVTGLFAFSASGVEDKYFIIGTLSILVSILTSLQTFLKFEIKAKNHQDADVGYGQIRHDIEEVLTFINAMDKKEIKAKCEKIRLKIENVNNHSPLIPETIWNKARRFSKWDLVIETN